MGQGTPSSGAAVVATSDGFVDGSGLRERDRRGEPDERADDRPETLRAGEVCRRHLHGADRASPDGCRRAQGVEFR